MGKIKDWMKNAKLEKKLTAAYSAVVLLSVLLLFTVIYIPFSRYLRKNATEYNYGMMEIMNHNMEKQYLNLDKLSALISSDSEVVEYLENLNSYELRERYDREYAIEASFGNILNYNSDLDGIYMVPLDTHDIIKVDYYPYSVDMYPENNSYFAEFYEYQGNKDVILGEEGTKIIFRRKIRSFSSEKVIGTLLISSNLGSGNAYLQNEVIAGEHIFGIADSQGEIGCLEGSITDKAQLYNQIRQNVGTTIINMDSKDYLLSSSYSDTFGWYIFSMVPEKEILPETLSVLLFITCACIGVFFMLSLFSAKIAKGMTRPLKELKEKMQEVEKGNFEVSVMNDSKDEIGQLSRNFNEMVERIKNLIAQVYLLDIKGKEAELIALQNQIEPHFLYNTLESIRNLAVLNDDNETAHIIGALGKFLRLKISKTINTVSLRRELEHVTSYVELMKMRYGDRLVFDVRVNEEMLDVRVVKLILQPVVENCIIHGYYNPLTVTLNGTIREKEGCMLLVVEDNGRGIDEENLVRLRNELMKGMVEEAEEKIGLKNVQTRIRLAFGLEYGLEIESREGRGTRVTIRMPLNEGKKGEE